MGKHSNLILISGGTIIDSIKRVDFTTSSYRQVLPGLEYKLPPEQDKLCIENTEVKLIVEKAPQTAQI